VSGGRTARFRVWVLLLLTLGLALRIGYVLTLPDRPLDPDETDYVESARGLLSGTGFDRTVYYHVPPVPPMLLAGVFSATGISFTAARLFQCVLFLLAGWVAFSLGRELAGDVGGLVTLALVSVYPYFIFFAGQVGTEAPALVAIPAVVLAGVRAARRPTAQRTLVLGAVVAVATLVRASVLDFIVVVPVALAFATGLRDLRWLRGTALALIAFLGVYLPWCAVNRHYFGEWIATPTIGSGIMLYQTALRMTMPDHAERWAFMKSEVMPKYYYPPGASHAQRLAGDRYLASEGKRMILENLDRYPEIMWFNFKRFWQFYPRYKTAGPTRLFYRVVGLATYGLLFPFLLVGLAVGLRRYRELSILYLFIGYFTAVHVVLFGKLRYRIPMDPLLLAFAAFGLVFMLDRLAPKVIRKLEGWMGVGRELLPWRCA